MHCDNLNLFRSTLRTAKVGEGCHFPKSRVGGVASACLFLFLLRMVITTSTKVLGVWIDRFPKKSSCNVVTVVPV